ncbi:hypothetical protein [Ferruginibacter sp.]
MKQAIIIENRKEHFDLVYDILNNKSNFKDFFINVWPEKGDEKTIAAFRNFYLKFVIDPGDEINNSYITANLPSSVDLFMIDFHLLSNPDKVDYLGGILRKKLIKQYFPNAKVIFLSRYDRTFLEPFMEEGDVYFDKTPPVSTISKLDYWKQNIIHYLKAFFPNG